MSNSGFDPTPFVTAANQKAFARIDQVIQAHLEEFRKPRVLTVRPGYEIVGGKLTRTPAIVVIVRKKVEAVPPGQTLPSQIEGFPVDVRQAGTLELLRADDPARYAAFAATGRREYILPDFPYERDLQSGLPMAATFGPDALAAAAPKKENLPYTPAPGVTLDRISDAMAITCHVSPDAGWVTLKEFFNQIKGRLTVGMYDFTAKHILDELVAQLKSSGAKLTLTLDHPTKNPTADQTDEETVQDLETALGNLVEFAWALERMDPKVSVWIYNSAYHIKVAVSNGERMWLSSGNWNKSNQPEIDTSDGSNSSIDAIAKKSDRDWHLIVDHPGMSEVFEAFLKHDYDVAHAQPTNADVVAAASAFSDAGSLTVDELSGLLSEVSVTPRAPEQYFQPKRIPADGTRNITVQPLLTPDPGSYRDQVLALIRSATRKFYMQTQYIHPSSAATDQAFTDLINAVIDLQQKGVDVRIILSQWQLQNDKNGNPQWWERLQQTGLDLTAVKIQSGVHNKGIVVDSKVVLVSSQNWSGDGVLRNRDAGLILFDEEAAAYYEQVFLHDWQFMAQAGPLDVTSGSEGPFALASARAISPLALAASSERRRRGLRYGQTPLESAAIPLAYRVALRRLGLLSVEQFLSVAQSAGPLLSNYLGTSVTSLAEQLSGTVPARAALLRPIVSLGLILTEPVNAVLPQLDVSAAVFSPAFAAMAFGAAGSAQAASGDVNLIPDMQPIRDQGSRGTCVAHACVACLEHFFKTQRGQALDFSEQYLFYDCKQNDGLPDTDGTFVKVAMPLLFTDGCCLERTWNYNPSQIPGTFGQGPPPANADAEAAGYKTPAPRALPPTSVAAIKAELARGLAVAIAVPFYANVWLADEILRTGDISMPIPGDFTNQGHAVCLMGYEDLLDEPEIGGGRFLVRNSWNSHWGTECNLGSGYGTIPYAYITTYCREAYSIG